MKKFLTLTWKYWLLILSGIILWLVFAIYRPFEPHYQWKPLSAWTTIMVNLYSEHYDPNRTAFVLEQQRRVAEAIRHIGTNALPYAMKWSRVKDSPLKQALLKRAGSDSKLCGMKLVSASEVRERSVVIFQFLGPVAKPAIPDLINLLEDDSVDRNIAANGLTDIGPDAIPPLIDTLTNQNASVRGFAVISLGHIKDTKGNLKSEIHRAIPALIGRLNDEVFFVRESAADALGRIQQDAPTVVPALIDALKRETNDQSSDFIPASWTLMRALCSFHTNAQSAVSVLTDIIERDPSGRAREAMNTLRDIAPEIAEPYIQKFNSALTNPPPDDSVSNLFYNYYGPGNHPNKTDRMPSAIPAPSN